MRIRVIHLWIPSAIFWGLAVFMSFSKEPIGAIFFTGLYIAPLICTKWTSD